MEKITLSNLRRNLVQVVDQVLKTGNPVAVECGGKTLLLTPQAAGSKIARLKRRKLIQGDPASLVNARAALIKDGETILNYKGPRIPISDMRGGARR